MSYKFIRQTLFVLATTMATLALGACSPGNNSAPANSPAAQATPIPSPKTEFEDRLEYVKKGQYTYVWVFSRKDGKPLDKDDSAYLRTNAPQVVDWVLTDDGTRVIAGTNFDLALGNLGLLQKRFTVEDYTGK